MRQRDEKYVIMIEKIVSLVDARFDGKSPRSHFTWDTLKML